MIISVIKMLIESKDEVFVLSIRRILEVAGSTLETSTYGIEKVGDTVYQIEI